MFKKKVLFSVLILMAAFLSTLASATENGGDLPQCTSQFDNLPCATSQVIATYCTTDGPVLTEETIWGEYDEHTVQQLACNVRIVERCEKSEASSAPQCSTTDLQVQAPGF